MSDTYRIGEVAQLTGVSVETLRYYERRRLLKPPPRTDGGFRRYAPGVVTQVRFIKQAQALGLTLDDVQDLMQGEPPRSRANCRRVHDLLCARITELDVRLAELKELRGTLDRHLESCRCALRGEISPCPTIEALERGP
jgi:DNA-binding transcriptional MerR regulator